MRVNRLQVEGLRCLHGVDLAVPGRAVWLAGPNGAGKTSVLEAIALLGFGRSFRGRVAEGLLAEGRESLQVVVHWIDDHGRERVSGLRHAGDRWEARLDGVPVERLSDLAASFPVLAYHPESVALVTGPAEERRRLVDWLAFHVEPDFLDHSRRATRALRQRNSLLRAQAGDAEFEFWEEELARAGTAMTLARRTAVEGLAEALAPLWTRLAAASAAPPVLHWRAGWREEEAALRDLLYLHRGRDRELGYTTLGPHRADLLLGRPYGGNAGQWSRGQAKLLALALSLAQAEALRQRKGALALLLLDDLRAELDEPRFDAVLDWVAACGAQVWITGTGPDPRALERLAPMLVFHVEQGRIRDAGTAGDPSQAL